MSSAFYQRVYLEVRFNGLLHWYELLTESDLALKLSYDSETRLKLQKVDKVYGTRHKTPKLWRQHFLVFQISKYILRQIVTMRHRKTVFTIIT